MKLRKMMVILLALCTVFFLAGCGGGGGGSDDDEDDATWPVEYYMAVGGGSPAPALRAAPATGIYKYIYFYKDNTYKSGHLNNGTLTQTGSGSYSGGDPHNNVTLSLTGTFEGNNLNGESVSINSGSLIIAGKTYTLDGSSNGGNNGGGNTASPYMVSYIYRFAGNLAYIDFIFNGSTYKYYIGSGTCTIGDGTDDVKNGYVPSWEGTFTGDPRIDGTITVTGVWFTASEPEEKTDYPVIITSGVFITDGGQDFTRQ